MEPRNVSFTVGLALGIASLALVLLASALVVTYTGSYNVAATEDHTPAVRWAFTTTMKNSVKSQASDVTVPPVPTTTTPPWAGTTALMSTHGNT